MLGENISLSFEATHCDPNATVMASAPPPRQASPPPTTREEIAEPFRQFTPPPAYSGQVPPGPVEEFEMPPAAPAPKKSNTRTWILAGCGCLLLILCVLVIGGIVFDQMKLYCVPPFDSIFRAIGYCGG
jgi:hypothetical protein